MTPLEPGKFLAHNKMIDRQNALIDKLWNKEELNAEEILELRTFVDNVNTGFKNLVLAVNDVFREQAKVIYAVTSALEEFDLAEAVDESKREAADKVAEIRLNRAQRRRR